MKTNISKSIFILFCGFIGLFFDSLFNTQGSLSIVFAIATSVYFILDK